LTDVVPISNPISPDPRDAKPYNSLTLSCSTVPLLEGA
jgi:hypothetical protein